MAITVQRGTTGKTAPKPPPRRRAPRVSEPSSGSGVKVAIFCGILVVMLIVGLLIAATAKKKPRRVYQAPMQAQTTTRRSPSKKRDRKVTGLDELGGKTMGQWMKDNKTDQNEDLKARKSRRRTHESGR